MALTHEAGAAVTVRTYWAWETTATLHLLGGARGTGVPMVGGEGWGLLCHHVHSLFIIDCYKDYQKTIHELKKMLRGNANTASWL